MMNILSYQRNAQREESVSSHSTVGRIRQALLALLLLTTGAGSAWADTWNGTKPTEKWDAPTFTAEGITGSGTKDDPYVISNAQGFVYFWWGAYNGKITSSTQYWRLDADINLNNLTWTYIEKNGTFKGKFDGNNHTISNMKLAPSKANLNYGLFCQVEGQAATNRAEVKNLTIDHATIAPGVDLAGNTAVGFAVGKTNKYADIINVKVTNGTITYAKNINGYQYVGGIVGQTNTDTKVQNCSVTTLGITASLKTTNAYFGGLIGYINSQTQVTGCSTSGVTINYSTIANASRISGFIGYAKGAANVPVTLYNNTVTNTTINLTQGINDASYIGALVAQTANNVQLGDGTVGNKNTVTTPSVTIGGQIKAASYIGGVVGDFAGAAGAGNTSIIYNIDITNPSVSVNKVSVAKNYIGGVFGRINTYAEVKSVKVTTKADANTLEYKATDNTNFELYLGTFAGGIYGVAAQQTLVKDITITGDAQQTIGTSANSICNIRTGIIGEAKTNVLLDTWTIDNSKIQVNGSIKNAASYLGGFVGNINGAAGAPAIARGITLNDCTINITGTTEKDLYLGGLAGQATTNVELSSWKVTSPKLTLGNEIKVKSYIGSGIGNLTGPVASVKDITVETPSLTIKKISIKDCCIGNVFGQINNYSTVDGIKLTTPAFSYQDANLAVVANIGTVVGNIVGTANQQTIVKNVTLTGDSQLAFGTSTSSNIAGLKAGIIGQATTGALLDTWKITGNSGVSINGNLATASSYLGGFAGYLLSAANAPVTVNNITMRGNSSVSVTGNISTGSYLGGFAGQISASNNYAPVTVNTVEIEGTASVSVGGNVTAASYLGGFTGYVQGTDKSGGCVAINSVTIANADVKVTGQTTTATSYYGAMVGRGHKNSTFDNLKVTTSAKVTIGNNITKASYIGGGFGSLEGATANYPVVATNVNISGLDISLNCNLTDILYLGGIAGNLSALATTPNKIEKCTVSGNVSINGNHTFTSGNARIYAFGGIVGYMKQSATTFSEVNQCISEVNFNLGNLKPSSTNNVYSGFVIGGVIGRLEAASRLPEQLYYSGKVYAPSAAVGPIVGVFSANVGADTYIYNDYSGENLAAATTGQLAKIDTWFYNGYKIGLSTDVTTQSARTKNYKTDPATEDGVNYLTIADVNTTFTKQNSVSGAAKNSYTVLAYTANNTNAEYGIYPKWTINNTSYPAYYMYYMQGVNRGNYVENREVDETKAAILAGTLAIVTLADDNGDMTITANRGFISHKLRVTAKSSGYTYKWYKDGLLQSATSDTYDVTPSLTGNIIKVDALDNGKVVKTLECKLMPVFRVQNAANPVGTKTNPYLIGSVAELQLLSHLSTTSNSWENGYSAAHYNTAHYEMDADIDLSGIEDFTPISYMTTAYSQNYIFDGVFDGKQHKISGLKETWYSGMTNTNNQNIGWGLFSFVGNPTASVKVGESSPSNAAIRNLVIDGAVLTHKADNTSFYYNNGTSGNGNNCMVGVLAGVVASNTTIENIEIRNSKITDKGSSSYSLATKGLYVGGAIGSVQKGFNTTDYAVDNTSFSHVAAQVDVTLDNPTFVDNMAVAQVGQFNVGGIVGRYIATSAGLAQMQAAMPAYTFYSGTVNAPKAWISPVIAAVRYSDQQSNSDWKNFSKQWEGNNNSAATQLTITNAQYYNFYIGETLITGLTPSDKCDRGSRTIKWHVDATDDADSYNAEKYQGVNYDARFIDSNVSSLKFLNESPVDGVYWVWENGFVHMSNQTVYSYLYRTDNIFTANMSDGDPTAYRWEISMDGETWQAVTGGDKTYTPAASSTPKLIIAIVTAGGKEYRTQPELVTPSDSQFGPAIQYSVDGDNYTFTIKWNGLEPEGTVSSTYQWYHADKTTPFEGQTTDHLTISKSNFESVAVGGSVWCKVTITELEKELAQFMVQNSPLDATVIYVDGANGKDTNNGLTPETAVRTINVANGKLTGGSWDKNYIVVIGTLNSDGYFRSSGKKPATITGRWNGHDYEGVINVKQKLPASGEHYVNNVAANEADGTNCYVLGDTKFEYLTFSGYKEGNSFIELHGCDVVFGKGLVMQNFNNLSTNHGNMGNSEKIPEFTILLTATNLPESQIQKYTTERTKPQVVTFQSGHYGRLMGGRFTQNFFPGGSGGQADNTAYSILGSAANPVWAVINIEIADDNEPTDGKGSRYSRDINAVIAGLTDGSMYGDIQINYHGGDVAYIVGGNQGNAVKNGTQTYTPVGGTSGSYGQWPNASYFGRTVINVEQKDGCKAIAIGNLYAGGLGRMIQTDKASAAVDMYVYGRTEVNVKSGTIAGSVYGGGVGGVIGVNPWDAHAPYKATGVANNATTAIQNGVQYGDNRVTGGAWSGMTKDSPMAQVVLHNLNADGKTYDIENLDLRYSSTTVNVSGGTVNGNVYGGGYGFVQDMPLYAAMQGIGSVFGTANINITGGTILGNVFGGSQGSSFYYGGKNQYDQTINHIAEMNGTVNLTISGTEEKCPVIKGDIYGAGEGIKSSGDEDYLRIATAGNTDLGDQYKTTINLTIDIPDSKIINGNVFGGGKMGAVDGNINVVIKGGQINGNVYGGGKGEKDHLTKARVNGTTKVTLGEK